LGCCSGGVMDSEVASWLNDPALNILNSVGVIMDDLRGVNILEHSALADKTGLSGDS